jgi:hypothetical protein
MHSEGARFPVPSTRFFLLLLLLGGLVGLALLCFHAPFWAFYVAPLVMAPLIVWELRALESEAERASGRQPPFSTVRQLANGWEWRVREVWWLIVLGVLWALVATAAFTQDALLAGWVASCASGVVVLYAIWKKSRTRSLFEAAALERREFFLSLILEEMRESGCNAGLLETEEGWLLLLGDEPSGEDALEFHSEDEARAAARERGVDLERDLFTAVLNPELKQALRELRRHEEGD